MLCVNQYLYHMPVPRASASMSAWQKGIKSAGVRAVINGPSTTTGASIKVAPTFTKSSFIATNEVHCL